MWEAEILFAGKRELLVQVEGSDRFLPLISLRWMSVADGDDEDDGCNITMMMMLNGDEMKYKSAEDTVSLAMITLRTCL